MSAEDFITPTYRHRTNVVNKINKVLDTEAPISENLLMRRVVQSFGIARSGSRIQMFMRGIFRSMNLKTTVQNGDKFYWRANQAPEAYRGFRENVEGENKRDAKDIPVQEAANAVCRALEEQFSLPSEDLVRAAANLMGIQRLGDVVYSLFLDGLNLASKQQRIVKTDIGNWILKE